MALLFSALNFIQLIWGMMLFLTRTAECIPSIASYELEVTNNGPITTEAWATIQSTLIQKNNRLSPLDNPKYHFAWKFDAPLVLVEKIKRGRNSQLVVTSPVPGAFPVSVEVMHSGCWFCGSLARNVTVLQVSEFIVGNLSIAQMKNLDKSDCHHTSNVLALVTFSLCDPSHYFKSAKFIYKWDFGDGTIAETGKPTIYHNYSTIRIWTAHLDIIAEWRQEETSMEHPEELVQKTGHFTTTLTLLDEGQAEQETQDIHPASFVLPCIILLPAMLGLAIYMTFRSTMQQKDLVEVADFDFFPESTKKSSSTTWSCGQICCKACFPWLSPEPCSTAKEHRRLLQPPCKSRQLYSV